MNIKWIINEKLAISPMPWRDTIENLSKVFRRAVILVEPDELEYDITLWSKYGVDYIHTPVPELGAPPLLSLYEIIRWIHEAIESNDKVLIHCYNGKGRSMLVALAYIMYLVSVGLSKPLTKLRYENLRASLSWKQRTILNLFRDLLTLLPEPKLNIVYSIGVEYDFGRGVDRVSKVVELCIRLWHQLTKPLGIERGYGSILLATAILQDVGCIVSESNHSEKSVNILEKRMEELRRVFTLHEIMLMKTLILFHEINVLVSAEKLRSLGLSDNEIGQVLSVLKILRVATILV